jgi:hypothetical protein
MVEISLSGSREGPGVGKRRPGLLDTPRAPLLSEPDSNPIK